jgi:predicted negative regulator of RcsB-dependent stress response
MAGVQLTDEEQSERLKQWWRENGVSIAVGMALGIAVIVGVNYWRSYQAEQSETASALYTQLVEQRGDDSPGEIARKLKEEYAGTPYAGKAALFMARLDFENGRADEARQRLEWARDNAEDPADGKIAGLRLARIMLDANELDQAETLLSGIQAGGYESEYHELAGDLAMARGDPAKAREAYKSALESLPGQSGFADMLELKLDAAIGASQ